MGEEQIILQWVTFFLFLLQRYLFWYIISLHWPIQESEGSHCRCRSFWFSVKNAAFIKLVSCYEFWEYSLRFLKAFWKHIPTWFLAFFVLFLSRTAAILQDSPMEVSLSSRSPPASSLIQEFLSFIPLFSPITSQRDSTSFLNSEPPSRYPGLHRNFITQLNLFLGQPSTDPSSKLT